MGTVAQRRILPALPGRDGEAEIRWERWQPALPLSHIEQRCDTCGYLVALSTCKGLTWFTPEPSWERVERSHPGKRSRWVKVERRSYWCRTHWAVRCPACDETTVYRMSDWAEIAYAAPSVQRPDTGPVAGQQALF